MKKILTILLAVCAITMTACKKEKSDAPATLNGTSWEMTEIQASGKPSTTTYIFAETTFKSIDTYGEYTDEQDGTYTYKAPNLTITFGDITSPGIVNETEMVLTSPDGTEQMILKRK